ncbi:MAG: right-handed parallel beta-helix repeat-containing protein [Methanothrix sp.]|nr:right-handed parallel beta-helix repeat-containing protein [Methanothrix sp.]
MVSNISINNVGTGIGLYKTNYSIVEASNITNITDGIFLYFSNNNKIRSNTITEGEYGIKIVFSDNNSFNNNVIGDNLTKYIVYNTLGNNTFSNNSKKELEAAWLFKPVSHPALAEVDEESWATASAFSIPSKSSGHEKHKMPKTDVESTISAQPDDEDLKKLFGGIISFKPTIPMVVNETTDVIARIAPNNTSASKTIYAIKETDAELVIKGLTISKWMRLSLQDPGKKFQIEALSHIDQKILGDVPATWRWTVTPREEGNHRLILVATLLEEKENGEKEVIRDVDVQTELIKVIANKNETAIKPKPLDVSEMGKGISSFIKEIVGLLTAIFGLIVLYRKLKKGEGD